MFALITQNPDPGEEPQLHLVVETLDPNNPYKPGFVKESLIQKHIGIDNGNRGIRIAPVMTNFSWVATPESVESENDEDDATETISEDNLLSIENLRLSLQDYVARLRGYRPVFIKRELEAQREFFLGNHNRLKKEDCMATHLLALAMLSESMRKEPFEHNIYDAAMSAQYACLHRALHAAHHMYVDPKTLKDKLLKMEDATPEAWIECIIECVEGLRGHRMEEIYAHNQKILEAQSAAAKNPANIARGDVRLTPNGAVYDPPRMLILNTKPQSFKLYEDRFFEPGKAVFANAFFGPPVTLTEVESKLFAVTTDELTGTSAKSKEAYDTIANRLREMGFNELVKMFEILHVKYENVSLRNKSADISKYYWSLLIVSDEICARVCDPSAPLNRKRCEAHLSRIRREEWRKSISILRMHLGDINDGIVASIESGEPMMDIWAKTLNLPQDKKKPAREFELPPIVKKSAILREVASATLAIVLLIASSRWVGSVIGGWRANYLDRRLNEAWAETHYDVKPEAEQKSFHFNAEEQVFKIAHNEKPVPEFNPKPYLYFPPKEAAVTPDQMMQIAEEAQRIKSAQRENVINSYSYLGMGAGVSLFLLGLWYNQRKK